MYFSQLLLLIVQKLNGERSYMAPFYLLKGKKSGQTMQDVTYFQLHSFFSIYPNLTKEEYELVIFVLQSEGLIEMKEGFLFITTNGRERIKSLKAPQFDGWNLRGNELVFWRRLELVVQTISNFQSGESKFIPNQKDIAIHQFGRNYLKGKEYQSPSFATAFKNQLLLLLESPALTEIQRTLLVYRLSGYQTSGLTWDQLANEYSCSVLDMKLQFVESLHVLLSLLNDQLHPDIYPLTEGVYVKTPLTESAYKTNLLLAKGYTLEQIAASRNLKINTIEDHLIEIASANPRYSIDKYITTEQLNRVWSISRKLQTKKLRIIKEHVPELSYFMIRLALAKGDQVDG